MYPKLEYCCECGLPTGKAGRDEDSLYTNAAGPFCEDCFEMGQGITLPDAIAQQTYEIQVPCNGNTIPTESQQLSAEVDRLASALASLQTAHIELLTRTARAEWLSVDVLLRAALADKLPVLIEAEIAKQFNDFYTKEIERIVEDAISKAVDGTSVDCTDTVKRSIDEALGNVHISFGNTNARYQA